MKDFNPAVEMQLDGDSRGIGKRSTCQDEEEFEGNFELEGYGDRAMPLNFN